MSRNGSGVYSLPAGSTVTNGDTSDATDLNTPLADIEADLNVARPIVAGGTGATSASAALVNLGLTATAAEINVLDGVTASTAELNILDGVTATTTELNYVDGVTSAIQTQLNAKQASGATLTSLEAISLVAGDILYATAADTLVRLAKGTAGQVLQMNTGATAPEWASAASGTVLLGTITTTSGSSQSLTSLDLTPYSFLRLVVTGVSATGAADLEVAGIAIATLGAAVNTQRGIVDVDLNAGVFSATTANAGTSDAASATVRAGDLPLTTASTSVAVSVSAGTFDAGSIRVYGIK